MVHFSPRTLKKAGSGILVLLALACNRGPELPSSAESSRRIEPVRAIIRVDGSSLRIAPVTLASKIETLPIRTPVLVVDRTVKKERIGSSSDYWYRVRLDNGLEGWVFGSGVSFKENEDLKKGPLLTDEELKKRIPGKWWEILPDGATGRGRIRIWPEGEFQYNDGRKKIAEGTVTLHPDENRLELSDETPVGKELKFVLYGKELRLHGKHGARDIFFARGDEDPGSREEEQEEETKQNTVEAGEDRNSGKDSTEGSASAGVNHE